MMGSRLELALMDSLALDPALLACPDDSGRLEPYGDELRCVECERHYCAANGVWGLLPRASLDAASPQGQRLASYRAGYSDRRDRPWLHGFRVLSADLGNAYLYRWARRAIEKFAAGRTLRILDAACGDAMLWRHIDRRHQYIGADFSARPLSRAFHYHPAAYVRGDLNHLPFVSQTFDLVVTLQALQYLDHPMLAVREMARVLRPDGLLLATLPNDGCFKYRLQGVPPIQQHRFRRKEVMDLCGHEFTVRELEARGLWLPVPAIHVHLPGQYSERTGLSWTAICQHPA